MKKLFITLAAVALAANISAKDVKTLIVTTEPQMHCHNCENKIKNNIRFEKGVKKIDTNIDKQTVTIEYDAEKNTPESLMKAFGKFGYKAKEVTADK
jgi:copper chaperone CopZ